MGLPRIGALTVSQQLLDLQAPDLYERFLQLAEKYQYRDTARAVADAIMAWVETHERSDTGRPPPVHEANPDATVQEAPALTSSAPPPPEDSGPTTERR